MKRNKAIYLLILAIIAAPLASAQQLYYKSGTFKVLNATKQVFYPGVMGAPISTQVTFTLVLKKCARIGFDSFWMDGVADKVMISYANGDAYDGKALAGDTLLFTCAYYRVNDPQPGAPEFSGSPAATVPVTHKGDILFRYRMNGKSYFYSITGVKKGENIYAP